MSPALETISSTLLPELEGVTAHEKWVDCAGKFPWYPLPWLMLADTLQPASLEKASLWFTDEYRLHTLLHQQPVADDKWLAEQLEAIKKNGHLQVNEKENSEPQTISEPIVAETPKATIVATTETEQPETFSAEEETANDTEAVLESTEEDSSLPALKISFSNAPAIKENTPVFEPYHAVDYFASQGIRLNQSGIAKDKFEQQLKSFTQWLKTMKKVTPVNAPAFADPMVEAQAVESNSGKEVLTEAMALVLEKQGKFDKAVAIYEKLLLLHPEKGALFAARIEDLKSIKQ